MSVLSGDQPYDSPGSEEHKSLREAQRRHILNILKLTRYNLEEAARLLDVELEELEQLMTKLGIDKPGNPAIPDDSTSL